MKVMVHLHPQEAISVWAPTFTSEHGSVSFNLLFITMLREMCFKMWIFSVVPKKTVICACVFLALRWRFMASYDSSSASVNGCWHTAASHTDLLTKLFGVYVQTHVREQCLASDVSKKTPSETVQWQSHKLELFIIVNRLNLTAFVMRNVKIK